MTWADSLVTDYYSWLKENTFITQSENTDWVLISTPFFGAFNDGIELYARKSDEKIVLCDNGETINNLSLLGVEFNRSKKRTELLHRTLRNYGVKFQDNELVVEATIKDFAQKKHNLLSAIIEINDLNTLSKPNITSVFKEDIGDYLDGLDIVYTPDFILKGSTGIEFTFDYQVAYKSSEVAIKSFNSLNSLNLPSFLFSLEDIRATRQKVAHKELKAVAIINDKGKEIKHEYLDAITSKNAQYILWTEKDSDRSKQILKAA